MTNSHSPSSAGSGDTYVRKIAPGTFEFGYVKRSPNFRKRPDVYRPVGVRSSVAEAEAARAAIAWHLEIGAVFNGR
jgi:hypothetical protein